MSEYFIQKYGPVVNALMMTHDLCFPEETRDMARDMLADTISKCRELSASESEPCESRSAMPALRTARTHARKLIEYADHPPARKSSMQLRRTKLAAALRRNEVRVGIDLVLAGMDLNVLLIALDKGDMQKETLQRLVQIADEVEKEPSGVGRPWQQLTYIVRGGCIAWERAGYKISYQWNDADDTLTGKLSDFLRDLVTCCAGTHPSMKQESRGAPVGCHDPSSVPKGNALRRTARDRALRDAIRAWLAWCKAHPTKSETFPA